MTPMVDVARLAALSTASNRLSSSLVNAAVYEAEGFRWVASAHGAVQTAMDLAAPSGLVLENHRAMMLVCLLAPSKRKVLDLGLGGGAFLRHLSVSQPIPEFTAVENDPQMLAVAREYFALERAQSVHLDDAVRFLARSNATYDLVLCDVFSGREAPQELREESFYADLAERLAADGAAAVNTLPASEDEMAMILRAVRPYFAGVGIVQFESLGNVVLLLQHAPLPNKQLRRERFASSVYLGQRDMELALEGLVELR